jgi:hypothetical protein
MKYKRKVKTGTTTRHGRLTKGHGSKPLKAYQVFHHMLGLHRAVGSFKELQAKMAAPLRLRASFRCGFIVTNSVNSFLASRMQAFSVNDSFNCFVVHKFLLGSAIIMKRVSISLGSEEACKRISRFSELMRTRAKTPVDECYSWDFFSEAQ